MKKLFSIVLLSALTTGYAAAQSPSSGTKSSKSVPSNPEPVKKASKKASGVDQVWVNGKIYHCPGTRYFGKTKNGEYMTEKAAIALGATASHNRPCT